MYCVCSYIPVLHHFFAPLNITTQIIKILPLPIIFKKNTHTNDLQKKNTPPKKRNQKTVSPVTFSTTFGSFVCFEKNLPTSPRHWKGIRLKCQTSVGSDKWVKLRQWLSSFIGKMVVWRSHLPCEEQGYSPLHGPMILRVITIGGIHDIFG